jgi:hypothetical protein
MPFNAFGFNVLYILDRFASLIFTNFSWLLLSLVGAGFIAGIVRKKHSQSKERREYLVEVTVGAAASLIPLFLFVTYNHIRYAGPTVILVLLLLPEALDRLFVGIKWRVIVCGALAALSLLQCYLTVDPMMHLVCGELNKGRGKVAFANNYILVNGTTASSISVDSQYNREMMYFDFAIDAILEDIEYGSDTILIISDEYFEPTIGGYVGAEYLIMGFGYSYMENPKYVAWDADREMRYLSDSPHYAINVYYTNNQANISKAIDRYARCVYISLPFKDQAKQNEVFSNFNVTEIKTGNYYGWQLSAYELTDRG